jgi:hypothetical protein
MPLGRRRLRSCESSQGLPRILRTSAQIGECPKIIFFYEMKSPKMFKFVKIQNIHMPQMIAKSTYWTIFFFNQIKK